MAERSRTKDERFMLLLYDEALRTGDLYEAFDISELGNKLGFQSHVVENICKHLAQANFIKKVGNNKVCLTPNGERLVDNIKF